MTVNHGVVGSSPTGGATTVIAVTFVTAITLKIEQKDVILLLEGPLAQLVRASGS